MCDGFQCLRSNNDSRNLNRLRFDIKRLADDQLASNKNEKSNCERFRSGIGSSCSFFISFEFIHLLAELRGSLGLVFKIKSYFSTTQSSPPRAKRQLSEIRTGLLRGYVSTNFALISIEMDEKLISKKGDVVGVEA